MDPMKVKSIEDWEELQNVHDMIFYIGMTNFYMEFVEDYSRIATPLAYLPNNRPYC